MNVAKTLSDRVGDKPLMFEGKSGRKEVKKGITTLASAFLLHLGCYRSSALFQTLRPIKPDALFELDLAEPGTGFPTEVWANASSAGAERAARATLHRAPFDALVLDSRVEREASLRDDPIARGSLAMLAIAAGAAFLLALFAVALTTIADLRDDRDALLDLESQGAPPALLRRLVRTRQIVVGALGLALLARGVIASSPATTGKTARRSGR